MIVLFLVPFIVLLVYLMYPVFLRFIPFYKQSNTESKVSVKGVSLVLLSWNGKELLESKIASISSQFSSFPVHEFIVIDDCSEDGTRELLESVRKMYNLRLVLKDRHLGIPNSMNMAVKMASYDTIVFCDQRQRLGENALAELVRPLEDPEIGAVSAIISCRDNENRLSLFRKHENFLKTQESRIGKVIGVYGPLYAVRRECYSEIPEDIILDDLFLSLKILAQKRIVLAPACQVFDDDFTVHYNLPRSERYFRGLLQILFSGDMMKNLPFLTKIMVLWHKFLRLLIPPFVVLFYLSLLELSKPVALLLLIPLTLIFVMSFFFRRTIFFSTLNTFIRINMYYLTSMVWFFFKGIHDLFGFSIKLPKA